jgi:hypothetical protein
LENLPRAYKEAAVVRRDRLPMLSLSRTLIEFGNGTRSTPMEQDVTECIELRLDSEEKKVKWNIHVPACPAGSVWAVGAHPVTGKLDRKNPVQKITITVHLRAPLCLSHVLRVDVEGGLTYFLVVRASSEPSLFGTNLSMLELVPELGWRIPLCLVALRRHLVELGGLSCEGIFRVSQYHGSIQCDRMTVGCTSYQLLDEGLNTNRPSCFEISTVARAICPASSRPRC